MLIGGGGASGVDEMRMVLVNVIVGRVGVLGVLVSLRLGRLVCRIYLRSRW